MGAEDDSISKETFLRFVRCFMKVVKETVVTEALEIKSKTLRRLELGDVVTVLEGPVSEGTVDVSRARVLVMKDDLEAWVTVSGNQGTPFLVEGGGQFRVIKETVLTDSFDPAATQEETRKLKQTTQKLKVGELVDVYEWPRKEEPSGLIRMKCRTHKPVQVGWATTMGNQGTVFLEPA